MAATWLRWELERAGVMEYRPQAADVLLCTVSSQQGVSKLRGALRHIKNKRAKVVLGGGGAYAPAVFDEHIDVACVGEGARFIRTLLSDGHEAMLELPETWIPGDTRQVIPNAEFPYDVPPIRHPDGTIRVFGSRGCKHKCFFCQTGWQGGFSQLEDSRGLQSIVAKLQASGERVELVSNDATFDGIALMGQHVSARLQNLRKIMPLTKKQAGSVRIGVEGVSERLRVAVGKPVFNSELLKVTFDLLHAGVGVKWFFITGLPGETDTDYIELCYLVKQLKQLSKGCVMMNFHAFIPQPATPLCIPPLVDDYWERFDEFRRWFFHGPGFTRRAQIVAPSQYKGRLRRAMESMAATEAELIRGWWKHDNPNWRVKYLAGPDKLRSIARKYCERVGLCID